MIFPPKEFNRARSNRFNVVRFSERAAVSIARFPVSAGNCTWGATPRILFISSTILGALGPTFSHLCERIFNQPRCTLRNPVALVNIGFVQERHDLDPMSPALSGDLLELSDGIVALLVLALLGGRWFWTCRRNSGHVVEYLLSFGWQCSPLGRIPLGDITCVGILLSKG